MPTLKIYAIRDTKINAYARPFFLQNESILERSIQDALSDPEQTITKHPEDFAVFHLGEYEEETGKITAIPPEHLFNVVDRKLKG